MSVSLLGCGDYDYQELIKSIKNSFNNLGGIDKYINKGDRVLLKINLLMSKKPEEAVTTNPIFVKALAKVLIDYGAYVIIGDSPGGLFNEKLLSKVYRVSGIKQIADELDVELNYNTESVQVNSKESKYLKKLTLCKMIKDVDKVISVSKLKTHMMMTFTGAVKNMFGTVPGFLKAEYHYRMPEVDKFANALIDICLASRPVLSFMDGVIGMEGTGPSAGTPRKVGVVLASDSPFDLDVVAVNLISLPVDDVPTIKQSIDRGLCSGKLDDIEIFGEKIEDYIIDDFKLPNMINIDFTTNKFPKFLKNIMNRALKPRPYFHYDKCIGCRECEKSCPAKVIEMVDNKPKVDLDNCIRCFCCQELCPKEAVEVKQTALVKILQKR